LNKSRKGITQIQTMIIAVVAVVIVAAGVYYYMSAPARAIEDNKALARSMWDAVSSGNLNALDNIYSSDYKRYLSATATPLTAAQQKARLTGLRTAFPDLNLKIEDMSAEGDRVSVRMTVTGTHQGTFMGIAPTGKKVTIAAFETVRIANGKVVEHWGGPDTYDLLTQVSPVEANMALARSMWETVNRGDINALDPFYAPNYKRYLSLASPPLNSTQQKQRLAGLHAAFSNFNLTVGPMVAQGDFVAALLTFTGTQTGTFQGIPPTGKTGKIIFLEELRIVDGKVVEHWGGPDWSDMLKQLGVKFTPGP
jgi:steroid delta-isomerase-like uncharacterized protein